MIDALEIGYAIKNKRAELGMTQAQVAKAAGVSKRCLWSLELGQNPGVQLDKLTAVLNTLGLELEIKELGQQAAKATGIGNSAAVSAPTVENPSATADALAILTGGAR